MTELGICYSFNFENPTLRLTQPGSTDVSGAIPGNLSSEIGKMWFKLLNYILAGSNNALSLLLNVEKEEYTIGSQIDFGLKVRW